MIKFLILWMRARSWYRAGSYQRIINSNDVWIASRYTPFWEDEWEGGDRPPWYRPFNILLHCWVKGDQGLLHDHPRWSVTIVLRGEAIEQTPWGEKTLKPGSFVFRSRKYIHKFIPAPGHECKTWTLFIVGRRNHPQNYYKISTFADFD